MAAALNRQWRLNGFTGFDSLVLKEDGIPEVGDLDVLVRWKYASLNYRDLVVSKVFQNGPRIQQNSRLIDSQGTYPLGALDGVVVGSDAAGEVVKIGSNVHSFKPGDRVTGIHLQTWQEGTLKAEDIGNATGGKLDGVLQDYGVVPESALVKIPETLDLQQGSTLTIAAITAWDSLVGLPSKRLEAGQWVLTQGSGGVSVFAIQVSIRKLRNVRREPY
jgi:NADPH:quinone reductase-like Zn-dependent oxidoreductase